MTAVIHPPRMICGSEPRDQLGIGTYATFVQEQLRPQNQYPGDTFILLADYAALTHAQPESLTRQTITLGTSYLALGLDLSIAVIYRQSDVPQLFELFWLVACLLPPQYADNSTQVARLPHNLAETLYPALMATDILGLRASIVNQLTHSFEKLDYTRQIAAEINTRLGQDFFPIPRLVGDFPQPPLEHMVSTTEQSLFAGPSVFSQAGEFRYWLSALHQYGERHRLGAKVSTWFERVITRLVDQKELDLLQSAYTESNLLTEEAIRNEIAALMFERLKTARETYAELRSQRHIIEEAMQAGALRVRAEFKETAWLVREALGGCGRSINDE